MSKTENLLSEIRNEYRIPFHICNDVMLAFADNWFNFHEVPWQDLEWAYRGVYNGWDEYDAIGNYLYELADSTGDLARIPEYIKYHINWNDIGRDSVYNGELRAEEQKGEFDKFHIFSEI